MQRESLNIKPGAQTQPAAQLGSQLGLGFSQEARQAQDSYWAFLGQFTEGKTVSVKPPLYRKEVLLHG